MSSKKLLIYSSVLALVLITFAVVGKKAGWFGKEKSIKVATEKVTTRSIIEIITANGKIEPETEVKVTPDVSGEIVELHVKEGDEVKQGQLLLKIKPEVYMSARDQAEASVNSSKANLANTRARLVQIEAQFMQAELSYERNKKLWEQRTISESEWEQAQASYKVAKADVDAARQSVISGEYMIKSAEASLRQAMENLIKTTIYAPMTGTITYLGVEKGERVVGTNLMTGTEMLRIANPAFMEAKVQVNENDIVRVSLGDTAMVEVDAYLGKKFRGIVTEIANSANVTGVASDQVTNFDVKILLLESSYHDILKPGEKTPFRPGMTATVEIQTETRLNVLSIPIQAVTTRSDSVLRTEAGKDSSLFIVPAEVTDKEQVEIVYIPVKGKAGARVLKTGVQDNNYIEIISGLTEGEEVVAAPFAAVSKKLKIGSPIEIVDKKDLFKEEK
jgi:HlyD family secretion protein